MYRHLAQEGEKRRRVRCDAKSVVDPDRPELEGKDAGDSAENGHTQGVEANSQPPGAGGGAEAGLFGPDGATGERDASARHDGRLQPEQKLVRKKDAKCPEPAQGRRHSLITCSSSAPSGRG